jgi:GNAT superfamily N-acetyltransferase
MSDIAREWYSQALVDEMQPLLRAHYEEIAWRPDKIALDPDYTRYEKLEALGILRIYTARTFGELTGYAIFLVQPHLHYKGNLTAINDIVFVWPNRRGAFVGKKLLGFAEKELRAEGVRTLGLHIKEAHNWGAMAQHLGFEKVEALWLKWIGD